MTYKNPRLKHVKKIKELINKLDYVQYTSSYAGRILTQCNLLLETKKENKSEECKCCGNTNLMCLGGMNGTHCRHCSLAGQSKKKEYSLPNEKEILGMLDGLTIIVRK